MAACPGPSSGRRPYSICVFATDGSVLLMTPHKEVFCRTSGDTGPQPDCEQLFLS